MPVYRCPDFHCGRAYGRTGGLTRGSTRGPRGPKKPLAHRKTSEELQIISSATINFEASVAVDASPLVDQFKFKWTKIWDTAELL